VHTFACTQRQDVFKNCLFKEIVWILARNSPLAFLKQLKTSVFLSFVLIISSDEWQSKTQFNLQSSGENKSSCHAENKNLFSPMKTFKKTTFVYIAFL